MSEERSPMQREADRRAHAIARCARRFIFGMKKHGHETRYKDLVRAVLAYEEIEERQANLKEGML